MAKRTTTLKWTIIGLHDLLAARKLFNKLMDDISKITYCGEVAFSFEQTITTAESITISTPRFPSDIALRKEFGDSIMGIIESIEMNSDYIGLYVL